MRLRLGNVYSVFGMTLVVCCWWLGSLVSLWCLLHGYPTLKCSTLDVVRVAFTHSNGTAYSRILYVRAKRRNIRCWLFGSGLYARVFILTCSLSISLCLSLSLAHSHLPFACAVLCAETAQNDGWPFCTHGVSFRCAVGTLGMFHLGFVLSTFSYNRPIHSAPCTIHVHFSFRLGYTV